MKLIWNIIIAFFLFGCSGMSKPPAAPHLNHKTPTEQESKALANAAQEQYNKQYSLAIKQFQSILIKNPDNAIALYGLASSYYALGNFEKSLYYSTRTAEYKTPFLADTYMLMGLGHEKNNQINNAISTYQFAIKKFNSDVDLHYQLATAYLSQDRVEEAVEVFKKVIILDPYHRESHLRLGLAYYEHDYKTPALLSLLAFLLIEPDSKRAMVVIEFIDDIFKSGIEQNHETGTVELAVNLKPKKDEGDFELIDITMSARRIEIMLTTLKNQELEIKLEQLKSLLLIISQLKTNKEHPYFVENHYFPFFKSIYKNNLTEALLYYTHKSSHKTEMRNWLNKNEIQVNKIKKIFQSFDW